MSDDDLKAPTLLDVTKSVMWAMLGVQKSKNYERDFTKGKPWQYIVIGLIAVALFIGTIITVVRIVLKLSGV